MLSAAKASTVTSAMMSMSARGVKAMLALRALSARMEYSGSPVALACWSPSLRSCSSTWARGVPFSSISSRRFMRLFRLIDLPKIVR